MIFFPALFFVFIVLIMQGKPAKVVAAILAALTLFYNIEDGWWAADLYTLSFVVLVFLQSPHFVEYWHNYSYKAQSSKAVKPTATQIKHYRIMVFIMDCSFLFPLLGFYNLSYPDYTNLLILGSGVLAFILGTTYLIIANQGSKRVAGTAADKSLGCTVLAIFATWPLAFLTLELARNIFVIPAVLMIVLGALAIYGLRGNMRYLAAGSIAVLSDYLWRVGVALFYAPSLQTSMISMQVITGAAIIGGLIWLLKKPGLMPLLFLTLIIASRYFIVMHQLFKHVSANISTAQLAQVSVFQTCWMLITPVLLWAIGLRCIKAHKA